ncbi:type II toxin-antitoxin system VapC family toxin [Candidatus Poriferisodalis sp.]|uniref:type II toxin-antitoxin system VapC family toxin n=1 Tax=Candidatus Poriferisodalis sp. TaxID=3101277 RepID=UPI003B597AD6
MLYVESSALMKRYRPERETDFAIRAMADDPVLVTSHLTEVEIRRHLPRFYEGEELARVRRQLQVDLDEFALVGLDADICSDAARIAEETLCRSLDAIHLAAARRASPSATVLTFDQRQARAARTIGLAVVGA